LLTALPATMRAKKKKTRKNGPPPGDCDAVVGVLGGWVGGLLQCECRPEYLCIKSSTH